ncbi:hypothetical protein FJ365_03710 [Candidatus Dependentiae bacterium]|nr:hypothetical protein [Candidatus Dependentiae bacterium]
MKSMLHEASSVAKAIEKAWAESGKPREFTINVLEPGVKNFFGFSKLPAIISITFDPKSVPVVRSESTDRRDQRQQQKPRNANGKDEQKRRDPREQRDRSERNDRSNDKDRPVRQQARSESSSKPQRMQQVAEPRTRDTQREQVRDQQREQNREAREHEDLHAWTPDLITDLQVEVAGLVNAIGIPVPYTVTTDKRNAHIAFNAGILPMVDDERQLFMSMSYLLIQFLKKKHKKKLRGFHITVTTNRHDASQQSPADS